MQQRKEGAQNDMWDDFLSSSVLALTVGDEPNWNSARENLTWGSFAPIASITSPSETNFSGKWKGSDSTSTQSSAEKNSSSPRQDIEEHSTRPPSKVEQGDPIQPQEFTPSWRWADGKSPSRIDLPLGDDSSTENADSSAKSNTSLTVDIPRTNSLHPYPPRTSSFQSDSNGQNRVSNTAPDMPMVPPPQYGWSGNDIYHDTRISNPFHPNYSMRISPVSPLMGGNGSHYGMGIPPNPSRMTHLGLDQSYGIGDIGMSTITSPCLGMMHNRQYSNGEAMQSVPTTRRSLPENLMYSPFGQQKGHPVGRARASSVIDTLGPHMMYEGAGSDLERAYNTGSINRARAQSDASLCCSRGLDDHMVDGGRILGNPSYSGRMDLPHGGYLVDRQSDLGKSGHKEFFYEVEFKRYRRDIFYSDKEFLPGTAVKVEADRGEDLGRILKVSTDIHALRSPTNKSYGDIAPEKHPGMLPKKVLRHASEAEMKQLARKTEEEEDVLEVCRSKVRQRLLPMKVIDAEFQFDRHKLTFFFEADRRIDFRELVRDLFAVYKTRIWLQQVTDGIRKGEQ